MKKSSLEKDLIIDLKVYLIFQHSLLMEDEIQFDLFYIHHLNQ